MKNRQIKNPYVICYAYVMWFATRRLRSSFTSLDWLSKFQFAVAPTVLFACYFMALMAILVAIIPFEISKTILIVAGILFVVTSAIFVFPLSDESVYMTVVENFKSINMRKRNVLDVVVVLSLAFALPVLAVASMVARAKN